MSIREDILHHLYKRISMVIILLVSLCTSLLDEFLQPSLLMSLGSGILQLSLLTYLWSYFILTSLWNIFQWRLYKDIHTVMSMPSKPEMFIQCIQVKSETPKSWVSSCLSLHSYLKLFYKFITYYTFNNSYNIDTWNIRRQVIGYSMSLKRKPRMKLKLSSHEENKYNLMFNNVLTLDSDLLWSNTHKGCCVLNASEYNYKLRNVIGRGDESKITKWTWFNTQVHETFLCLWMISRKLVDHTNIGRAINCLLDLVYAPSTSTRDSIRSTTSFLYTLD